MKFSEHKTYKDDDLDLGDPYSKISCLVLYLYSLELGSPPLYSEINRVSRTMDKTQLFNLGPYIMALGIVIWQSEQRRDPTDKIQTGSMIDS